jgi:hypothetical protein
LSDSEQLIVIIGWLVLTGIGVWLTTKMMLLTRGDLKLLRAQNINGATQAMTKLSFWQEARRFSIKALLFLVGIISLFSPQVPEYCRPDNKFFGWAFAAFLYMVVIVMNYSTIQAMRFRSYFIHGGGFEPDGSR